ncbi:hypothetical protein [Nocardioides sp. R-C-SC26]|uniref:hypothetical protein n=1 Tax=Nocardioides sp. R-C-SC26 TaxID=2870414 RepID=UPI001E3EF973|nr:hypothetical protein [Nocardioides sp. R-C-SC26]
MSGDRPSAAPAHPTTPATSRVHGAAVALLCVLLLAATMATPAPAQAQGRVSVSNDRGSAVADLTYRTTLTVRGSGFQVVRGGFGGAYVMFGWVSDPRGDSWRPSRGGLTGEDYQYIPDAEDAADNQGYLKYVAFPGSSTAGEAATVLSDRGSFSLDLVVPGPVFQSVDRDGDLAEVDCRRVSCGIITVGAHGVKNATNESFTPVRFGTVYDSAPDTAPTASASPGGTGDAPAASPGNDPTTPPAPATPDPAAGAPSVAVDRATAVAGRAMAFVGRGFQPGEQVNAVLDDGVAGLGPLVAGASGEVAGVLQLPADLAVGTHELRMSGAASGISASELFPVAGGDVTAPAPGDEDAEIASWIFLGAGVVALLAALAGSVVIRRRRSA